MSQLRIATAQYLQSLTNKREGETKLGERMQVPATDNWQEDLQQSDAKFVLLGIPEDIGVRANHGVGGAHTLWEPALRALCNVQHTNKLQGEQILVLGDFELTHMLQQSVNVTVEKLRSLVAELDDMVAPVIEAIAKAGKIPIVIGGGHNNAYPIIKGVSNAKGSAINCINLDAHSDYRAMEGRHSGNGFRYARHEGYLDKYAIIGLHENYNSQNIIDELDSDAKLHYTWYEDIFIRNKVSFAKAIQDTLTHTHGSVHGVELDLDCIERVLSSAATPAGITATHARQYIYQCATAGNVAYLHITEGATQLRDGRDDFLTAKLVAYLVTDFVRARL